MGGGVAVGANGRESVIGKWWQDNTLVVKINNLRRFGIGFVLHIILTKQKRTF